MTTSVLAIGVKVMERGSTPIQRVGICFAAGRRDRAWNGTVRANQI